MKLTANFAHTSVCCATPESVIPHHGLRRRVVALQGEVSWLQGGKCCRLPTKRTFPSPHTRRSRGNDRCQAQSLDKSAVMRLVGQDWNIKHGQAQTELQRGSGNDQWPGLELKGSSQQRGGPGKNFHSPLAQQSDPRWYGCTISELVLDTGPPAPDSRQFINLPYEQAEGSMSSLSLGTLTAFEFFKLVLHYPFFFIRQLNQEHKTYLKIQQRLKVNAFHLSKKTLGRAEKCWHGEIARWGMIVKAIRHPSKTLIHIQTRKKGGNTISIWLNVKTQ